MNKSFKLFAFAAIISISTSALAKKVDNDYDSNFYATEGSILFKLRGSAILSKGKTKSLPAATSAQATAPNEPKSVGHLISNGYAIEGATAVFFGDNIAAELSLGVTLYKTSKTALEAMHFNYTENANTTKSKNLYAIPLSLLAQYHIAPFGAIRPYLGAGYHASYFLTKAKEYKIGLGHGFVGQAGVDFVLRDDTMINFDIKYYSLQPKITFKKGFVGESFSKKLKINPIAISAGIGFKF